MIYIRVCREQREIALNNFFVLRKPTQNNSYNQVERKKQIQHPDYKAYNHPAYNSKAINIAQTSRKVLSVFYSKNHVHVHAQVTLSFIITKKHKY